VVPVDFLFSLTLSRLITHIRKLDVDASSVNRFVQNAASLAGNLGVIIIRPPPKLRFDESLMEDFLAKRDTGLRYAVEARSKTFAQPLSPSIRDDLFVLSFVMVGSMGAHFFL